MSGKSILLLTVFAAMLIVAIWRGLKMQTPIRNAQDATDYMNAAVRDAELAPVGVMAGTQPSFPSPDTLAPEDPGAPGSTPLFFGGSIPTQG